LIPALSFQALLLDISSALTFLTISYYTWSAWIAVSY